MGRLSPPPPRPCVCFRRPVPCPWPSHNLGAAALGGGFEAAYGITAGTLAADILQGRSINRRIEHRPGTGRPVNWFSTRPTCSPCRQVVT